MKKILVVSPFFPPANTPDLQRVRMSLLHFSALGWDPTVLAAKTGADETVQEADLMDTVPADLRIEWVRPIPLKWSAFFGVGNLGLRAWVALFWRGCQVLHAGKFDLVYFSTAQFLTFPLGRVWRALFGVPYALDFQDPWRHDYYESATGRTPPGGWKYRAARAQAWLLEGWCVRGAAAIVAVSPGYLVQLASRYVQVRQIPRAVIPVGASDDDVKFARKRTGDFPARSHNEGQLNFVSTGAAGPIMRAALEMLFAGFAAFRDKFPEAASKIRFQFLGTSYAPPGKGKSSVCPIAQEFGVADSVEETPDRLGHLEALRRQGRADALVLLGSNEPSYSPSKIYPYLLAGKPILALVLGGSEAERVLQKLGGAFVATFAEDSGASTPVNNLHPFFLAATRGFADLAFPAQNPALIREYLADFLTQRQVDLFNRATVKISGTVI